MDLLISINVIRLQRIEHISFSLAPASNNDIDILPYFLLHEVLLLIMILKFLWLLVLFGFV